MFVERNSCSHATEVLPTEIYVFGKVGWLGVYGWINFGEKSWYLSSVQNPGWVDYTTQLYGDYKKPVKGSL